ncbi:MAG: hypothetical protein K8T25_02700 [Planctomycetia bacterium]|nr:hypothetical protein [Planctomycetia bacterium]
MAATTVMQWRRRPLNGPAVTSSLLGAALDNPVELESPARPSKVDLAGEELDFRHRQFRRRLQASLMIAAVGVVLVAGEPLRNSAWYLAYAVILLSLVGWVMLLAMADAIASRHHFARIRQALWIEEAGILSRTSQANSREANASSQQPASSDEA